MKEIPQQVSESVRRRNPHLYGGGQQPEITGVIVNGETVPVKIPKRIRQSTKPLLNKLESEWFEVLKCRWKIIVPQGLRFMLANGTWYKPDFIVWPVGWESDDHRLRAFECKGPHAFRGGKENLKIAAHQYPQIKWELVWKKDGQWQEQTIYP
jgi:hypothetical protein